MTEDFKIEELPSRPSLTIRTRDSVEELPRVLGEAYSAIITQIEANGANPSGPPFLMYYNLYMQDLDIEIVFPVSKILSGKGSIKASEITAGK
ncbi:MAG: hypothetical protein ACFFAS_13500 [Promethearchaeota archaeon]